MKTAYKYILLGLLTAFPLASSFAQTRTANDSTLNRQILLEREFDPTVKDASKISTLPAIHQPVVKQANVQYETKQPMVNFDNFPVGDTGPCDVKTEIDYNKKRGYLSFGAGTYSNMEGAAGYRIVDMASDQLDLFARYSAANGKVKYAEKGYDLDEAKAKFNDILVGLRYQHNFSNMSWHLGGGYENMGFNYYGNSFGNVYGADLNTKQSVNIINVETGIKSIPNSESVKFDGLVKYNNFSTKYGPSSTVKDGISGNIIEGQFNIGAYFDGSSNLIGVRLNALNQSFGDVDFTTNKNDYFHSLTKLAATPHFDIEGDDYTVSLGVKASYAIDDKNKFLVSPDVRFSWQFAESSSFYGNIGGGINENTYVQMLQKCRYINPSAKVAYSQTIVDGVIGVKSGIVDGLEFDIFGGYKQTNDDHLFVYGYTDTWGNTPTADYYDVGTGHFGGLLKTNLIPYTDLSVKAVGYFYNVDGDEYDGGKRLFKPWNLPTMTFDANIDVKPIENLTISAAYHLAAGRKALAGDEIKMKNINELNFRAEYQLLDFVSVYGKLNNVLNQKYDSFYGYTHQGFNVLGGIAFKF